VCGAGGGGGAELDVGQMRWLTVSASIIVWAFTSPLDLHKEPLSLYMEWGRGVGGSIWPNRGLASHLIGKCTLLDLVLVAKLLCVLGKICLNHLVGCLLGRRSRGSCLMSGIGRVPCGIFKTAGMGNKSTKLHLFVVALQLMLENSSHFPADFAWEACTVLPMIHSASESESANTPIVWLLGARPKRGGLGIYELRMW